MIIQFCKIWDESILCLFQCHTILWKSCSAVKIKVILWKTQFKKCIKGAKRWKLAFTTERIMNNYHLANGNYHNFLHELPQFGVVKSHVRLSISDLFLPIFTGISDSLLELKKHIKHISPQNLQSKFDHERN